MNNKLTSNWLGRSTDKAPTLYRAASKGKVFTRAERLRMIKRERENKTKSAECREMLMRERQKVSTDIERRKKVMEGISTMLQHENCKIRHEKNELFIQPRENEKFQSKITL